MSCEIFLGNIKCNCSFVLFTSHFKGAIPNKVYLLNASLSVSPQPIINPGDMRRCHDVWFSHGLEVCVGEKLERTVWGRPNAVDIRGTYVQLCTTDPVTQIAINRSAVTWCLIQLPLSRSAGLQGYSKSNMMTGHRAIQSSFCQLP